MLKPNEPRYTGSIEVPRETFEQAGRRWTTMPLATPLIVVTNPEGHIEEPTIDPEPKMLPPVPPALALPATFAEHATSDTLTRRRTMPAGTFRRSTQGPRPLPTPAPAARPLPRPTLPIPPVPAVPPKLPPQAALQSQAPSTPSAPRPIAHPTVNSVQATAPVARDESLPTSPPPSYSTAARQVVGLPPSYALPRASDRRSPPPVAEPLPTSASSRRGRSVSDPTASATPQTSPREQFMVPGGRLVTEYDMPEDMIGLHIRCADHKHLTTSDWQNLSAWLQFIGERIGQADWPALVTYIADLPAAEHEVAVQEISALVEAREQMNINAELSSLFSVLPQFPSRERFLFGLLVTHGLFKEKTGKIYSLPIMQLLAAVWPSILKLLAKIDVSSEKTALAKKACGVALALVIARDRPSSPASQALAPSVPLDEDACRRVMEVVLAAKKGDPARPFLSANSLALDLIHLANQPGPVPIEFHDEAARANGQFVAEALMEEFKARPRAERKPSPDVARAMWAEGISRAAMALDVEHPDALTQSLARSPSPIEWSQFKSTFGMTFDSLGWARPLLSN